MKVVSLNHPELRQILDNFSLWFFNQDLKELEEHLTPDARKRIGDKDGTTSLDYLKKALSTPVEYGYPKSTCGVEMMNGVGVVPTKFVRKAKEANDALMEFFGARNNALQMYYPAGGYIGWHNNCNASGYNIVLSCNPEGDGEFEHYDHINNKLNVFKDEKNWNVKVGYFGSAKEQDKIYWHCARTRTPRITFSYVVYDKNIWNDMVADIEYAG